MLKLAAALSSWTPGEGKGPADPVVLLGAGWSEIVGEQYAQHSHPAQLTEDTLIVVTSSGAWSQQLSYLADDLLAALAVRLPHAGIARVRFRVGKLPVRGPRPGRARSDRMEGTAPVAREPAADADEALARFRESVDATERAKRAHGWKECGSCTALIAPASGLFCTSCEIARVAERERHISRLLYEAPWLGFAGTAKLVDDLRPDEYESIRRRLLSRWWDRLTRARRTGKLSRDGAERPIASSYVLLKSELAPERLTPAIVRNVLGDELHDFLYDETSLKR
jgi:hypothetical protein